MRQGRGVIRRIEVSERGMRSEIRGLGTDERGRSEIREDRSQIKEEEGRGLKLERAEESY
jgi:hypothetical protein